LKGEFVVVVVFLQDFSFILKGLARLMTNPLIQTYLPNSAKKIRFHQELLVLFWKLCDFNKVRTGALVPASYHSYIKGYNSAVLAFTRTLLPPHRESW
jgi:hypothetical protein